MIKRLFDLLTSTFGMLMLAPVITVLAWQVRRKLGSPVLFRQTRPGKNGKPFEIIKFRTMRDTINTEGNLLTDKERMTHFGSFLRSTSLDELPELWNVLKGDMSLVGPRPGLPNQFELSVARDKLRVFEVRPGITGLAQISGVDMSTPELLAKIDAKMITNMSFRSYFRYLFLTILGKGQGDRIKGN